ncbi:MAG: T9SS type A sorting domain-containing protein [Candidatus Azobacteroides sp.]|nr:T9SS type A sorting domain-containing protein [Candidatus Azobacteroides sp.]
MTRKLTGKKILRKTNAFIKLGMIFMLCIIGLNVSAQTELQTKITNTAINGTLKIDYEDWYVVRKVSKNGKNYAFLISQHYLLMYGKIQFNSSGDNKYQNSNLRTTLEDYYQSYMPSFHSIAVIPDLGNHSSESATSEPTATLAEKKTSDIFFAPSYRDVYNWNGNKTTPLIPQIKDYHFRWWTRTARPSHSTYVWEVNPPNDIINNSAHAVGSLNVVGGIWVLLSPIKYCESPVIWTPETNSGSDKNNWNNTANWTPAVIPSDCNDVYIPGNSTHYPKLTSPAVCRDIYFIQGAELGRPDLLTYEKARVQLNFDLKQTAQQKNNNKDLVLKSKITKERMLFSAAVSSGTLSRERWYMFSSPLRGVVTGDLSFGGFPLTFLMKFGPIEKDGANYPVGKWSATYTSSVESAATNPTDGFAFYMYGYGMTGTNAGCAEFGYYSDLGDSEFLPKNRNSLSYGIRETNGILELPFFEDSTLLYSHRTQVYNSASNTSTFYTINNGKHNPADFNKLTGTNEFVTRESNNGNYRFAPEKDEAGSRKFQKIIHHPVNNLGNGDEFLAGNPYMSSIDMVRFLEDNASSVDPSFRIWNGKTKDFIACNFNAQTKQIISSDGSDMYYIAPFQGFFLKYKGRGNVGFNVETISTVRPAGSSSNLRNARETSEENILRIKAENQFAASYAVIGYKEGASNGYVRGEDVEKLFSPYDYVPSVYSLADDVPTDINFINNDGEIIIPLGIKTEYTGEIRLTFTGMNNYTKASKIELIDALEGRTIDLTGKSSDTYAFDNTEKGIQNGRFLLRIGASATGLSDVVSWANLNVFGNSKGIFIISSPSDPVLQVIVYDSQGKKVFESASGAQYYPLPKNIAHSPLIVKVVTKNQVKTAKIIY